MLPGRISNTFFTIYTEVVSISDENTESSYMEKKAFWELRGS